MPKRPKATVPSPAGSPGSARPRGEDRHSNPIEVFREGVPVPLTPDLEAAVQRAYHGSLQPLPAEMTTTQAAEFLDVSRPFVIKLITRKELPCRMVGTHRRIPSAAVLAYREKMFQEARSVADEMTRQAQELGLYDMEGPDPEGR